MATKTNGQSHTGHNQALDALFWRDEILQVMFWLQGEGLAEVISVQDLETFLDGETDIIQEHLEQAAEAGYLVRQPELRGGVPCYALSELGRQEGGRRFADEFAEMQKSGHGECNADCSCHQTGDHANCPSHNHSH